jgi:SAM-dependent methyltransferase
VTASHTGTSFYDDPQILERYIRARARSDEPNKTLEEPYVLAFLGDVHDHDVLDLGCGDAAIGTRLLESGARSYTGVDGSHRQVDRARRTLLGTPGVVEQADLDTWAPAAGAAYHTVISRMALHYVADLGRLLGAVHRACQPGAQLIFSVEHPVVTSSYDGDWDGDVPRAWTVRDYYRQGPRDCSWLGGQVRKYHRTFETYLTLLLVNGFDLRGFSEGEPLPSSFADQAVHASRLEVPMYATFYAIGR